MNFFEISVMERRLIQKFKNRINNDDEDLINDLFEDKNIIRKIKSNQKNKKEGRK